MDPFQQDVAALWTSAQSALEVAAFGIGGLFLLMALVFGLAELRARRGGSEEPVRAARQRE